MFNIIVTIAFVVNSIKALQLRLQQDNPIIGVYPSTWAPEQELSVTGNISNINEPGTEEKYAY